MLTVANVLAMLARADVDSVVVGGLAVAQAGFARYTENVDLPVDAGPANVGRLIGALSGIGEGAVRIVEDVVKAVSLCPKDQTAAAVLRRVLAGAFPDP